MSVFLYASNACDVSASWTSTKLNSDGGIDHVYIGGPNYTSAHFCVEILVLPEIYKIHFELFLYLMHTFDSS